MKISNESSELWNVSHITTIIKLYTTKLHCFTVFKRSKIYFHSHAVLPFGKRIRAFRKAVSSSLTSAHFLHFSQCCKDVLTVRKSFLLMTVLFDHVVISIIPVITISSNIYSCFILLISLLFNFYYHSRISSILQRQWELQSRCSSSNFSQTRTAQTLVWKSAEVSFLLQLTVVCLRGWHHCNDGCKWREDHNKQ